MELKDASPKSINRWLLVLVAWLAMLFLSDLLDVFSNAWLGAVPAWLPYLKLSLSALFLGICLLWGLIRPLWPFTFILFVFNLAIIARNWLYDTSWWQGYFSSQAFAVPAASYGMYFLGVFILDIGLALAVIGGLYWLKRDRKAFFLTRGQLDASIAPVRWLGIKQGESWRVFGWIFTLAATCLVAIPTLMGAKFTSETLSRVLPMLPLALLFAAINAFTEEVYYRASFLSTLTPVLGGTQALWISMAFFGLAHYLYGSPPGVVGLLMTGFLAFLLGKSMLETKGMLWAWIIHFLPDCVVFISYAIYWT